MIKLNQIKPNFTEIILGEYLKVYFSYKTIIAFELNNKLTISENEWGPTTGKHLNYICSDKSKRISHADVYSSFYNNVNIFGLYNIKKQLSHA